MNSIIIRGVSSVPGLFKQSFLWLTTFGDFNGAVHYKRSFSLFVIFCKFTVFICSVFLELELCWLLFMI